MGRVFAHIGDRGYDETSSLRISRRCLGVFSLSILLPFIIIIGLLSPSEDFY